ncbi:MAG TPA: hypothetical protein VMU77_01800 [Acidimicrobiales bacterium]|nr:hypothetical protein [Acidimicrobiales bacterium]
MTEASTQHSENAPASALLGPSEPAWANRVHESRLTGILNLSCLLSPVTYISDNDIADNRHFFSSFLAGDRLGIYQRLRLFAEMGILRILLRDQTYRPTAQYDIETFTDVYKAWLEQDPIDAWMLQEVGPSRLDYFRNLDQWATGTVLSRYSYRELKMRFMENVRSASRLEIPSGYLDAILALPEEMRDDYYRLIDREWFSLTDFIYLFQKGHLPSDHPAMFFQGLMNQVTFCGEAGSSLVGADSDGSLESELWEPHNAQREMTSVGLAELIERADEVLDGPSLVVLSDLRPDEIAFLRAKGAAYFALLNLASDDEYWARDHPHFGRQFVRAAVTYWAEVCQYIQSNYSAVVENPTRLAVFLGYDPGVITGVQSAFSLALEAGSSTAGTISGINPLVEVSKKALSMVKLRFLFLTPTEELDRIRAVLPNKFWFRRSRPQVLR